MYINDLYIRKRERMFEFWEKGSGEELVGISRVVRRGVERRREVGREGILVTRCLGRLEEDLYFLDLNM